MCKYSISVVMPAYNVEKYIGEAINSIINQSFPDWELIIVDDCSKDHTVEVVGTYISKYPQIRLIKREQNSGGCRLPRFDGILAAQGKFVCPVDSDDLLEKDYLQKLYRRQQETNSTLVLGRMIICDETGKPQDRMIPSGDFNFNTVESGKDACKKTIGGWTIALGGLLSETAYYQDYIRKNYHNNCNFSFVDEVDHRRVLLEAENVAYVDAHYYYRQQPNSIVHHVSYKKFDVIKTYLLLNDFVFTEFQEDEKLQNKFCLNFLMAIYYNYSFYFSFRKKFSQEEQISIKGLLSMAYLKLKTHQVIAKKMKDRLLLKNLFILKTIARIQSIYSILK